jgi:hypothetical protein
MGRSGPIKINLTSSLSAELTGTSITAWLDREKTATFNSAPGFSPKCQDNDMNLVAAPVSETFSIVGTCINCTAPASLLATMTIIAIGVALAFRSERRNGVSGKA